MNLPPPALSDDHHPKPSLSTALFELTSLIDLCTTTLHSVPTIPSATSTLLPCAFNPTHHVPPSSLFSHYLRCPSSVSLQHTLRYPDTFNAPPSCEFHFPSNSAELCFSLESYFDHNSPFNNFFYQSCPGTVVLVNNDHSIPPPPSLTLPRVLYLECANFNEDGKYSLAVGFSVDNIRFLPSEIWATKNELQGWGGGVFPTTYSFRILRAIVRLQGCMLLRLHEWVVVNSPKYGVIIDFPMRDHMIWLVKFCLKAIMREAFGLAGSLFSGVGIISEDESLGFGNRRFECPVLFNVLMWLASQFGILYGEARGKIFTLDVFKECIMESSLDASLFPFEGKTDADSGDLDRVEVEMEEQTRSEMPVDKVKRNEKESIGRTLGNSMTFISQVAAAVAALHERSMVECNIRASRCSQPLSAYQRNMEHAYVSKIADEERQKRSDYRPIIDHDGLLCQRSRNQNTNKVKTREELLAQERDYKRRRMSYRGKKLKRNTTEVIRDIIEEYMEEIKQAGEIGSMSKAAAETYVSASEYSHRHDSASVVSGSRNYQVTKDCEGQSHDNRNEFHSRYDSEDLTDGVLAQRQDSSCHSSLRNLNGNTERVGLDRDYNSRSRGERHDRSRSLEQMDRGKKTDNVEMFEESYPTRSRQSRTPHERNSHKKERGEGDQSIRKRERYEDREYWDRGKSKTSGDHRDREEYRNEYRDRGGSKRNQDCRDREEVNNRHWDRGRSKINRDLRDGNEDIGEHRNRWRNRQTRTLS